MATDRNEKLITFVALALLGVFVLQAVLTVGQQSPTMDEQNHIARGYAYLRTGDLRLSREHPPLINAISALPLLILRPQLPTDHPAWQAANWYAFADQFLWRATDSEGQAIEAQKLVNWARLPIILLGLLLGMAVYAWASELYGSTAGLLALALYAFSPNLLAHTSLATNDLGVTCLMFLSLYTFWRFTNSPSIVGAVAAGVALGLALGAKFSALVLLPILALLAIVHAWRKPAAPARPQEPELAPLAPDDSATVGPPAGAQFLRPEPVRRQLPHWQRWLEWKWLAYLAAIVVIGLAVLWGLYGLERGPLNDGGPSLPMPSYWNGLRAILNRTEGGNPTFLMGQYSTQGWWYYFPVALAIKTSLPLLLLLALALALTIHRQSWRVEMWWLLPAALYFVLSLGSSLNIGYRHLLPILPLLMVYVGKLAVENPPFSFPKSKLATRLTKLALAGIVILLLGWHAFSALSISPHYLAFFNELVGGPEQGRRYLVDSNLDWGQDLPALRDFLAQQEIDQVYLSWFGPAYPERYGIDFQPLPGFPLYQGSAEVFAFNPYQPAPGLYAISATHLQGAVLDNHHTFAWFRDQTPLASLGYSILLYRVPEPKGLPNSVSFGGVRYSDVPTATLQTTLTRPHTLVRAFDPATSFIAPATGDTTYFTTDLLPFEPALRQTLLDQAQTVSRQQGYTIYRLDASLTLAAKASALATDNPVWISPAIDFDAGSDARRQLLSLPVGLRQADDVLTFMGYTLSRPEVAPAGELGLTTFWRVLDQAPRSLTLFAHLLDAHSRVWAAWDGLDVSPYGWQRGDILVQHIRLTVPVDAPQGEYQLEIGGYTAADGQRLVVFEGDQELADRLLLQSIRVAP
ncbi:MAG: glycosyltransferase family 39 protein [Chloroflexota bacterium]